MWVTWLLKLRKVLIDKLPMISKILTNFTDEFNCQCWYQSMGGLQTTFALGYHSNPFLLLIIFLYWQLLLNPNTHVTKWTHINVSYWRVVFLSILYILVWALLGAVLSYCSWYAANVYNYNDPMIIVISPTSFTLHSQPVTP